MQKCDRRVESDPHHHQFRQLVGRLCSEKPSLFGASLLKLPEPSEKYPLCSCLFSALGGSSALHIPAFPGGGCLIDYVPQVCHLLTNKVKGLPPCEAPPASQRSTHPHHRASPSPSPCLSCSLHLTSAFPTLNCGSLVSLPVSLPSSFRF